MAVPLCDAACQRGVCLGHLVGALLAQVVGPQPSCGRGLGYPSPHLSEVGRVIEGCLVAHEGKLLRQMLLLAGDSLRCAVAYAHDGVSGHGRINLGI